jgi:hypothetical protein
VPVLRVTRGQQRSLTSPVAEYPQVSLVQVRLLIAAQPKLGFRGDLPGHRGMPAGGGDSPLTLRARAGGCDRRQGVGDGRHPSLDDRGGLAEHFGVLRDMFGRAPPVRIGIPGQWGDSARG